MIRGFLLFSLLFSTSISKGQKLSNTWYLLSQDMERRVTMDPVADLANQMSDFWGGNVLAILVENEGKIESQSKKELKSIFINSHTGDYILFSDYEEYYKESIEVAQLDFESDTRKLQKFWPLSDSIITYPKLYGELLETINDHILQDRQNFLEFDKKINKGILDTSLLAQSYLLSKQLNEDAAKIEALYYSLDEVVTMEDLYYYEKQFEELEKVMRIANAEDIKPDDVNGDGVYYIKSSETHKWGVYQILGEPIRTVVPASFDSIAKLEWNQPFVQVFNNNKVGLHTLFGEEDSLALPCEYDSIFISEVYYLNYSNFVGYRCIVKQEQTWFFVDWRNGTILSEDRYSSLEEAKEAASISFAKKIDDD